MKLLVVNLFYQCKNFRIIGYSRGFYRPLKCWSVGLCACQQRRNATDPQQLAHEAINHLTWAFLAGVVPLVTVSIVVGRLEG